ncbi:MAG: nucleotidyltransferase domain-containing protein [Bacteroidota bacterium]
MKNKKLLLAKIKKLVHAVEPKAKIILYGSVARGDDRKNSDIDLLILVEKNKMSFKEEKRITYPLYELEFDSGQIISPMVFSKKEWEEKHRVTPFYENIKLEGIEL